MKINVNALLEEKLKGKILKNLEYGSEGDAAKAEEEGVRYVSLPRKIIRASMEISECGEDAVVRIVLEPKDENEEFDDGLEMYAYANEDIEIEDSGVIDDD